MSRSMGFRVLRTLRALVRKDLSDVRLLLAFVLLIDVAVVLLAHLVLQHEMISIGMPTGPGAVALGVLSMVPIVAEIYSVDERVGTASLMRALPVAGWTRALSKIVSVGCVVALAVGVVLFVQEVLYLTDLAIDPSKLQRGLEPGTGPVDGLWGALGLLGPVIMLTAVLAVVVRNSLAVTLGTVVGSAIMIVAVVIVASVGSGLTEVGLWQFLSGSGAPLGLIAAVAFLMAVTPLRGRATRSALRRAFHVAVGPMLLAGAAAAGVAVHVAQLPPLVFDDPLAEISVVKVSPDGTRVAVSLVHHDRIFVRSSIWIAETSTWEFTRVPGLTWLTGDWRRWAAHENIMCWTADGRLLMVALHSADGMTHEGFSFDPEVGALATSSFFETILRTEFHGAPVRRDPEGERRWQVELRDGSLWSTGSHRPRVALSANDIVFYLDDDRSLHRLDRASGEDRVLPVQIDPRESFRVCPDGRLVLLRHRDRSNELFDVETGRTRMIEGTESVEMSTRRDAPCLSRTKHTDSEWRMITMDGEETVTFERAISVPINLDGHRWIGRTYRPSSLYVFDADGSLVRTLFEGAKR